MTWITWTVTPTATGYRHTMADGTWRDVEIKWLLTYASGSGRWRFSAERDARAQLARYREMGLGGDVARVKRSGPWRHANGRII